MIILNVFGRKKEGLDPIVTDVRGRDERDIESKEALRHDDNYDRLCFP